MNKSIIKNIYSEDIIDNFRNKKDISKYFSRDIFFYRVKEEYIDENTKAVELIINCKFHPNEGRDGNYSGPEDLKAANLALKWGLGVDDFCYSYDLYEVNYYNCKTIKDLIFRRRVLKEIDILIEKYNLNDYNLFLYPSDDLNDDIEYIGIYGSIYNYIFKDYNLRDIERRIKLCVDNKALINV